jgi:pseudouridine-5'-phosphate glycosidase
MLLVQPPPAELAIDPDEIESWIAEALRAAANAAVSGGAVTPFVLAHVARVSGGRALRANIGLIVANARTAGSVAVALAQRSAGRS